MDKMNNQDIRLAVVGHVDHGKSTILGRLLADTHSLPDGKLEFVKENCRRNSKPFEYAFLLDALKDEQAQGITIDAARIFFNTKKRKYTIMDAPGHIEFLKNMVTGASNADAALLVIDAEEGIKENSKRHGYLLSMLGIRQVTIVINKMDLIDYSEKIFKKIKSEYGEFLKEINIKPLSYLPVSGIKGDNIVRKSKNMPWYHGKTLLKTLDEFISPELPIHKPLRIPVQDIYKFTKDNDNRRIIAGRIESGKIKSGDSIIFLPSGKKTVVKTIEYFNGNKNNKDIAGNSTGFTIKEQIYIKRGQIAVKIDERKPYVSTVFKANIFWLGKNPIKQDNEYDIKLGTAKVKAVIKKINKVIDASTLSKQKKRKIDKNDTAEVVFELQNEIAFDTIDEISETSRFVIIEDYEICGGGIIIESIKDRNEKIRKKVLLRDEKWITSDISHKERAVNYNQKSQLILITGKKNSGRKILARELEKNLFYEGKYVYYMGMGNVLYGVDADIKVPLNMNKREEHIRRLAEIAYLMMDSGIILIVTALELNTNDINLIKTIIESDNIISIWTGKNISTDIIPDIQFKNIDKTTIESIKSILSEKNLIFNPE